MQHFLNFYVLQGGAARFLRSGKKCSDSVGSYYAVIVKIIIATPFTRDLNLIEDSQFAFKILILRFETDSLTITCSTAVI